jgi:hypothetical protein
MAIPLAATLAAQYTGGDVLSHALCPVVKVLRLQPVQEADHVLHAPDWHGHLPLH